MAVLFGREVVITVGTLRISSRTQQGIAQDTLRVQFKVTRALKKDPNTATVAIYNLNKSNRSALQVKRVPTVIEAGYVDNVSQIFGGDLTFGSSQKEDVHWVTTVQSGDGDTAFKTKRINTSFKGPIKLTQVLDIVGESLGINLGNLKEKVAKGGFRALLDEYTNGVTLSGKSEQVFDRIAKAMGFTWSIQDAQILLLGPKETITGATVVLQPGTGLIGSPEPGEDGIVKARSLLQPELVPGRRVQIISSEVEGFFRVEKIVWTGDTRATDWYSDIEAKPL